MKITTMSVRSSCSMILAPLGLATCAFTSMISGLNIKRSALTGYAPLSEQSDDAAFASALERARYSVGRETLQSVGEHDTYNSSSSSTYEKVGLNSQMLKRCPGLRDDLPPVAERHVLVNEAETGKLLAVCRQRAPAQNYKTKEHYTDTYLVHRQEELERDVLSNRNYLFQIVKNKMDLIVEENRHLYTGYDQHSQRFIPKFLNANKVSDTEVQDILNGLLKSEDGTKKSLYQTNRTRLHHNIEVLPRDSTIERWTYLIESMAKRELNALFPQKNVELSSDAAKAQVQENGDRLETGSGSFNKDIQQRLEALLYRAGGTTSPTSVVPKEG